MEIYFDTLYTGWLTGWYSILTGDDYSMNAKAKSQWVLIKLPFLCVDELREQSYELDTAIAEYEDYIANEGIPYWDYKIYRTGHNRMKPINRFRFGVKRIMRISVGILMRFVFNL